MAPAAYEAHRPIDASVARPPDPDEPESIQIRASTRRTPSTKIVARGPWIRVGPIAAIGAQSPVGTSTSVTTLVTVSGGPSMPKLVP
jgi:hypothetical protein